tara:strand:- start:6240 stop:7613 length:1374 start_codon:yes stop_codon:yes gene_type:complete
MTKKRGRKRKNKTISLKKKVEKITFYKKVPEINTVNGYKILVLPRKTNVCLIECVVLGGNYFELKENSGVSHLLEHILLAAWKKCKLNKCSVYWEKYGVQSNAYTSISTNGFWIKGLSNFFDKMLEYIVEIMLNPKFNESVIKKEKAAVENELNQYLNKPSWKLQDAVCKNLYTVEGMRYADDVKLQLDILKSLTKKKLLEHFNDFYTKKNILFIVSSHLDKKIIIDKFDKLTRNVKKNKIYNFIVEKTVCTQDKKDLIFVKELSAKNTDIEICFPLNIYMGDRDYSYLDIVLSIVGGDLTSLLVRILRGKLKLVYGVSCSSTTNMCGTIVYISVSTLDKNVKEVAEKIFEICKQYSKKLISSNKLLHAKRKYKMGVYQKNLNSVDAVSNFYAPQFLFQLNDKNVKIYTLKEQIKKINGLTKEKVRSIIKRIFNTKNCLIAYQSRQKSLTKELLKKV